MKKILIVDDDPDIRNFISLNMKRMGLSQLQAGDATEAMSILIDNEIDLILCDVDMHGMSGYEFLEMLRKKPRFKLLPFIFITSHSSDDDKIKAYSLGADNFISKPFSVREFQAIVESSLKRIEIRNSYGQNSSSEDPRVKVNKVLLVDDEPFLAELLKANLEQEGLNCVYSDDARAAIKKAAEFKPDLIISDYNMPDVDGFAFRKMLLEDSYLKDIPFVFFTSNEEENVALSGFDLNIKDFISKKTSIKLTVAKVKNILTSVAEERRSTLVELKVAASEMSLEFRPEIPDLVSGCNIDYWHQPYKDIPGGDFVDFMELPDGRKILVMGDIMGKKWGAWFYTFSFISYIRSTIRVLCSSGGKQSASELLQNVNSAIYNDSKISQVFSAISVIVFPAEGRELVYSGAGDLPVFHYHSATGNYSQYESSGILLGARADGKFDDIKIPMQPGDRIVMFTDGILDSSNSKGEAFGLARFIDEFKKYSSRDDLLGNIKKDFVEYTNNDFSDDITLLSITMENGL